MITTKATKALGFSSPHGIAAKAATAAKDVTDQSVQDPTFFRVRRLQVLMLMILFALSAAAFLMLIGQDALLLKNDFQFFADSNTYLNSYNADLFSTLTDLVKVSENYLGPVLVLRLLGANIYLVMLLNVTLFYYSVNRISLLLDIDPLKLALLLLASPITISSLLSINKEIFIFPFLALALTGYVRRSIVWLVAALFVSVLVRWQVTAFYLVVLGLPLLSVFKRNIWQTKNLLRRRVFALILLLLAGSIFYVLFSDTLAPVILVVDRALHEAAELGGGSFTAMLDLQKQGLYFLVFPLKALHLLFAMGFQLDRLINPHNVYNDIIIVLHCQATLVLFAIMIRRKIFTLRSELIFLSSVFLAVFCLTPIYAPRYLYPVYVFWALVVAGSRQTILRVDNPVKAPKQQDRMGREFAPALSPAPHPLFGRIPAQDASSPLRHGTMGG
jgi:hypothetical protein